MTKMNNSDTCLLQHMYARTNVHFSFSSLTSFQHIKHRRDSHSELHLGGLRILQKGCLTVNKSECHALFTSLLLLWWLDRRQSHDCWPHTSAGMPETTLKLASTIWPSKSQPKAKAKYQSLAHYQKAEVDFQCVTYFFLTIVFNFFLNKKHVFLYDFEQIFLLKSHIRNTSSLPLAQEKKYG